jgi:hypothetical protein
MGSKREVVSVGVASVGFMGSQCRVAAVGVGTVDLPGSVEGSRCRFSFNFHAVSQFVD